MRQAELLKSDNSHKPQMNASACRLKLPPSKRTLAAALLAQSGLLIPGVLDHCGGAGVTVVINRGSKEADHPGGRLATTGVPSGASPPIRSGLVDLHDQRRLPICLPWQSDGRDHLSSTAGCRSDGAVDGCASPKRALLHAWWQFPKQRRQPGLGRRPKAKIMSHVFFCFWPPERVGWSK